MQLIEAALPPVRVVDGEQVGHLHGVTVVTRMRTRQFETFLAFSPLIASHLARGLGNFRRRRATHGTGIPTPSIPRSRAPTQEDVFHPRHGGSFAPR